MTGNKSIPSYVVATNNAPSIPQDISEPRQANRRATVRYRYAQPNPSRAFIANSTKSEVAEVIDLSSGGIGLILSFPVENRTMIRIELGHGDKTVLIDTVAEVVFVAALDNDKWRCGCEWLRPLTAEELQMLL